MSRVARARAGMLLGLALIALGLGYQLGPGYGLAAFGAGIAAGFLFGWLYEVDDPVPVEPENDELPRGYESLRRFGRPEP